MNSPTRSMNIQGLVPTLPERGRIKIGQKGHMVTSKQGNQFQPPQKLDHFIVTTMERDPETGNFRRDEAIHAMIGDRPTRIPVTLLYDDINLNMQSRRAAYRGKTLQCSGDGVSAQRLTDKGHETVTCPCPRGAPDYTGQDKCKINGSLSCMIQGASGLGGVWKFRTTSYNSVVGLLSTMTFLQGLTGGPLAGIPFDLVLTPKTVTAPGTNATQTVYVVGLEFTGTMNDLRQGAEQLALSRSRHQVSMQTIEAQARALLAPPTTSPLPDDDDGADVVAEFYPEQVDAPRQAAGGSLRDAINAERTAAKGSDDTPPHDPETGEVLDQEQPAEQAQTSDADIMDRANVFLAAFQKQADRKDTLDDLDALMTRNRDKVAQLPEVAAAKADAIYHGRRAALTAAAEGMVEDPDDPATPPPESERRDDDPI